MESGTKFQQIGADNPLFDGAITLRDRVLRAPLGRQSARSEGARDLAGRHFVALNSGVVVGCLGLFPDGKGSALLRSMAVAPERQGEGIGAALISFAAAWAKSEGISAIEAEARVSAIGFYEACGFHPDEIEYSAHGVPHRRVRKALGAS